MIQDDPKWTEASRYEVSRGEPSWAEDRHLVAELRQTYQDVLAGSALLAGRVRLPRQHIGLEQPAEALGVAASACERPKATEETVRAEVYSQRRVRRNVRAHAAALATAKCLAVWTAGGREG